MSTRSPLTDTDSYKLSHRGFLDPKTEYIYSNFTARSAKHLSVPKDTYDNKMVVFGVQYFIKDYLIREWNETFFQRPKAEVISRFKRRCDTFLGPGALDMAHFEELHDLGYLPISIKIIPEGERVNIRVPFFTIINTHPHFAWLTNYLETIISSELWKPVTTATLAFEIRRMMHKFAMETVGHAQGIEFLAHGFEARGMSGRHDVSIASAGHLLSFWGTDSLRCIDTLEDFYNANAEKELIGCSVPASEHSLTSEAIAIEGELNFFRRAITQCYPTGIVSLVSDTEDFWRVMTEYLIALKDDILARKPNALGLAKVVFRPDSGNPVHIICGNPDASVGSPEHKGAIECLWEVFGGTVTEKGYRLLHERAGLIYGDSCSPNMIRAILEGLRAKGFASTNVCVGVGSYTYNFLSRDVLGMAIKATWVQADSKGYDIFKTPKTDDGTKNSARGLLRVDKVGSDYVLTDRVTAEQESGGELKEVFRDGKLLFETSLAEIRARINAAI